MTTKFAQLVTALEEAGIKGHQAYEIANQIDLALVPNDQSGIEKIAQQAAQDEAALLEALDWIEAEESE